MTLMNYANFVLQDLLTTANNDSGCQICKIQTPEADTIIINARHWIRRYVIASS